MWEGEQRSHDGGVRNGRRREKQNRDQRAEKDARKERIGRVCVRVRVRACVLVYVKVRERKRNRARARE